MPCHTRGGAGGIASGLRAVLCDEVFEVFGIEVGAFAAGLEAVPVPGFSHVVDGHVFNGGHVFGA